MTATLPVLVSLSGLSVAAVGLLGVAAPTRLIYILASWRALTKLPVTLALRVVFGCLFVVAAPDCRLPSLVRLVGVAELGGAAVLLGLGTGRLERFVGWWLERPSSFVRCWCVAAFTFGILLVYAGA